MSNLGHAISNFPIVAWCQENLRNVRLGPEEVSADCPFCYGYRKLNVNIEKRLFHCFKCREGGHGGTKWTGGTNLFNFMVLCGQSRAEAYKEICRRAGVPDTPLPERKTGGALIPPGAIFLKNLPDTHPANQYLERRHCAHLSAVAWVVPTGKFRDRVILPCNYLGELKGTECKAYMHQQPKSLFFPEDGIETSQTVYTCLNWDLSSKTAVLSESILDAETFRGVNSLSIYGSRLHEGQVSAMLGLGIEKLIWALDGDAYIKPFSGVVDGITRLTLNVFENWVCRMGYTDDPNSLGPEGCENLLKQAKLVTSVWDLYAYEFA